MLVTMFRVGSVGFQSKVGIVRLLPVWLGVVVLFVTGGVGAQTGAKPAVAAKSTAGPVSTVTAQVSAAPITAKGMMDSLIAHEQESAEHRNRYTYLSTEKSDRTEGHAWTERVVETPLGRIRRLLAVDGVPLTAEQDVAERGRLAEILKDPEPFIKKKRRCGATSSMRSK